MRTRTRELEPVNSNPVDREERSVRFFKFSDLARESRAIRDERRTKKRSVTATAMCPQNENARRKCIVYDSRNLTVLATTKRRLH